MIETDPLRVFTEKMPSDWSVVAFEEMLAEPVRNGMYKSKEFHGIGIKVVNMGELFAHNFLSDQEMKRMEISPDEERKFGLKDGDLLFARRSLVLEGSGKCSLVVKPSEPVTYESSIIRARPDPNKVDPKFLFYLFTSPLGRSIVIAIASRTAVSGIRGSELAQLGLPLPPLPTQRRIAGILSAYDELIANNQRRIAVLEQMARALYREWFVYFRAPRIRIQPGSELPEGWEVKPVSESFEISGGSTPSRKVDEYWQDGTIQWYSPSNLTAASSMFMDTSSELITELGLKKSSAKIFPPRCVMMTSRATIGAIAINTVEACTNQGFITCIPNEQVPLYYLYHWVKENVPTFERMASGATFKEISRGVFKTIDFTLPDATTLQRFEAVVEPIGEQVLNLQRQTANLRRTRDLLLPRLMSGRVEVM
jgi:type I restriction enzyme S subunit